MELEMVVGEVGVHLAFEQSRKFNSIIKFISTSKHHVLINDSDQLIIHNSPHLC